jgi:hypothetical protein
VLIAPPDFDLNFRFHYAAILSSNLVHPSGFIAQEWLPYDDFAKSPGNLPGKR